MQGGGRAIVASYAQQPRRNGRRRATGSRQQDWKVLCWLMVLRVAFYVQFFSIPAALIVNADHTGMHFLQHKGKGWFPPDMCDTKVQGHAMVTCGSSLFWPRRRWPV